MSDQQAQKEGPTWLRHWIISSIIAPVIVAVTVGMATGYITVQTTLTSIDGRIEANAEKIRTNNDHVSQQLESSSKRLNEFEARERSSHERMIRLETKIDILLNR